MMYYALDPDKTLSDLLLGISKIPCNVTDIPLMYTTLKKYGCDANSVCSGGCSEYRLLTVYVFAALGECAKAAGPAKFTQFAGAYGACRSE